MTQVELTISTNGNLVREPLLWRVGQEFNVKVNIKKANIDTDFGWVLVELEGPIDDIQRATAWLMTTGAHVEASERAVGA